MIVSVFFNQGKSGPHAFLFRGIDNIGKGGAYWGLIAVRRLKYIFDE